MTRGHRASRTIEAPATTVWELLTDAETYADWNDAVISIEGPIRQGETIALVSVVDPTRTFTPKVTHMQEPSTMAWSDGMPFGLFRGERTYTITDLGDRRSEFTMVEEFSGPLAGLITKAIPDMAESFDIFADGLKRAAEARADVR